VKTQHEKKENKNVRRDGRATYTGQEKAAPNNKRRRRADTANEKWRAKDHSQIIANLQKGRHPKSYKHVWERGFVKKRNCKKETKREL